MICRAALSFRCSETPKNFFKRVLRTTQAAALEITGSSLEPIHQLVEARRCLEVEMAGWAAERVTPEELSVIGQPYRSDT